MANFTRKAIKETFLALLEERPLADITVKDIVEKCGINRNSFYYHFQDIPSLLTEMLEEKTQELIAQYPGVSSLDECFHLAFRMAQENRQAVMHIYNSANRELFEDSLMRLCKFAVNSYVSSAFPEDLVPAADGRILMRFLKCNLFGMCVDWIRGGMKDAGYDELHRVIQLSRGVPELIVSNSRETSTRH